MAENSVRISVRVDDDTAAGLARVRASVDTLGRDMTVRMRVHGSTSGRGFLSGMTSSLGSGGAASTMTSVGSSMSSWMSRGITEGFNGGSLISTLFANPYVASATVAAGVVIGSALGAAIAGAVTLGFGAAFVGLGAYMIRDNAKVKAAWSNTISDIKKQFAHAADGLIPVAVHAAKLVDGLARGFAPAFKAAMDAAAPHLDSFLDRMAKGIANFGKYAFKPMMDAFDSLLDAMDIEGVLTNLGKAFGYLGKSVQDNATQVGHLLDTLLDLVVAAVYVLGFLTNMWGWIVKLAKAFWNWSPAMIGVRLEFALLWPIIKKVVEWLQPLFDWLGKVLDKMSAIDGNGKVVRLALDGMSSSAEYLLGWLKLLPGAFSSVGSVAETTFSGMSDVAETAFSAVTSASQTAFSAVKSGAQTAFSAVASAAETGFSGASKAARTTFDWLKKNWPFVFAIMSGPIGLAAVLIASHFSSVRHASGVCFSAIGSDAAKAGQAIQGAIAWVKRFVGKTVHIAVSGSAAAVKAVQSVINTIKKFVGKTVTVSVKAVVSGVTSTVKKLLGLAHGGVVGSSGFAHGGYVGHAAGGGPRSNRTLVGENGPEIVDLAPGSHVRSNPDTRRLLSQGSGDNRTIIEINAANNDVSKMLVEILKNAIRVRGGDVQIVLGK